MDVLEPAQRSALMRRIRQKGTAPELVVRRALHAAGLRFRVHPPELPGRPDIALPGRRVAIFVHGCYWHGHHCRAGRLSTTNVEYWSRKITDNRLRDRRKSAQLRALGWRVRVVWECATKGERADERMGRFAESIRVLPRHV